MVFSGDVGNLNQPIIRDVPQTVEEADYVVVESTYGDRLHDRHVPPVEKLAEYIQRTLDRGGNVVIPSFAVGRTQEMLYYIREIKQKGLVHATIISRYTWTARWPTRPPAFTCNAAGNAWTSRRGLWWTRGSTPSGPRG